MPRVLVAMSGGVDSSVAACLLREKGYDVMGATLQIWKEDASQETLSGCCGATHADDARRVASGLGIPFHEVHLEEAFDREVVRYFCEEYGKGRTPNPCVVCNQKIKFGSLLEKAFELGADSLSTGHYARVSFDETRGRFLLKKGLDERKDQSYVLFGLTQDQLRHTLFPLGDKRKEDVRRKALELGLPVYDKPESQEVCFVDGDSYHLFLRKRLKGRIEPGPILDSSGKLLGRHRGIPFYTIGQRRGLGLALGEPLYVIRIDPVRNAMIVGREEEVLARTCVVGSVNWILPPAGESVLPAQVKIRYTHPGSDAILRLRGKEEVEVRFAVPQKAITPGQAAVFYDGDTVLGGGWIQEVTSKE